jgi:folate-dependent phosphoribosylglycinamide formyltransferase PurN
MPSAHKNIVILISGSGSNMAVIARAAEKEAWRSRWGVQVAAVISNKAGAAGLELAKGLGIATAVVSHTSLSRAKLLTPSSWRRSTGTRRRWWCWPASCAS